MRSGPFWKKQSRCAGRRSPIFLTPKASRENISGAIGRTDAKGSLATGVERRSGERLWPGEAAIFAHVASGRPEVPRSHFPCLSGESSGGKRLIARSATSKDLF